MNFLAHCVLADLASPHSDALIAGGVLADFRKGPVPADWPAELQLGVRLHRRIDAVSNQLEGIRTSCARFPAPLRRYAPIFVDVHADRALSKLWHTYHEEPIDQFSARCYNLIDAAQPHERDLPVPALRFLDYMVKRDLLANYHRWLHIEHGIQAVCRRLRKPHLAGPAVAFLRQMDGPLSQDFEGYFPDLVRASTQFVSSATAER